MIVFQHTLLSLVANVQLSSNDVLQLGTGLKCLTRTSAVRVDGYRAAHHYHPQLGQYHLRIPTRISSPRPIPTGRRCSPPGARRIMRSIAIDQHSAFSRPGDALLDADHPRVSEPLATLLDGRDPGGVADRWFIDNGLTNLTLFRHYLMHYLAERPDIIKEMYIVARTLKPSPSGIPLEIYCFTTSTLWKDYENTQSAIFEYITAVAGQFSCASISIPPGTIFGVSPGARRPDGPAAVGRRLLICWRQRAISSSSQAMNRATSAGSPPAGRRLASSARGRDGDGGELHQLAAGYRPATRSAAPAPRRSPRRTASSTRLSRSGAGPAGTIGFSSPAWLHQAFQDSMEKKISLAAIACRVVVRWLPPR